MVVSMFLSITPLHRGQVYERADGCYHWGWKGGSKHFQSNTTACSGQRCVQRGNGTLFRLLYWLLYAIGNVIISAPLSPCLYLSTRWIEIIVGFFGSPLNMTYFMPRRLISCVAVDKSLLLQELLSTCWESLIFVPIVHDKAGWTKYYTKSTPHDTQT